MLPPVIKTRITLLVELMERGKEQTLLQPFRTYGDRLE